MPSTTTGSASVARNISPDLFFRLLTPSIKVTLNDVPAGISKTAGTLGVFGASLTGCSGLTELAAASWVEPFEHPLTVKTTATIKKMDKNGFIDPPENRFIPHLLDVAATITIGIELVDLQVSTTRTISKLERSECYSGPFEQTLRAV
ncbi:MAG: hypothetical protein DMG15_25055 [Acidobacteria bacterium]|nr:MAG: hypothetical protein DMG15_25055 [Acidobacteriota bacterium]